jgi:exopolyphosphatase/guanosine-5'-triphosphate,3'-diphosphate pyrophosphatase
MPRYAAVDIGSNSVRLLVAEVRPDGEFEELAVDRQVTRIGESVFRDGRISADSLREVNAVLARMKQAIDKLNPIAVRAVATSAVRDASNQLDFLDSAAAAIGAPVEIISGLEEARLIQMGVLARWPHPEQRVLMIDVGGGSAEVIFSDHGARKEAFSKPLGAVRLKEIFLAEDPPNAAQLHRMEEFILEKLAPCLDRISHRNFDRVIGTSATAAAVVCAIHRIPRTRREEADRMLVTQAQVRRLYRDITTRSLSERRKMPGIGPRRAEIIIPGAAVFLKAMEAFQVRAFHYSAAGVRDGVVADLAARGAGRERSLLDRDQRRVVEQMAKKYGVLVPHARHVAALAHGLFESLYSLHQLAPPYGRLLEASAYLHDVGHYISDSAHHKHSAYVVANSGMPGFTEVERHMIAMLCRFHRKSMPSQRHDGFVLMSAEQKHALLHLLPLLRLADSLDRSHSQKVEKAVCHVRRGTAVLEVTTSADTDLDLWAAERAADVFRQVYAMPLQLRTVRTRE